MTPAQLQTILKCPASRAAMWAEPLRKAMNRFHITGPLQQAAFIAQIGHESGRLRYVKELWGPTTSQVRYEGRKDLGNTEPGDGPLGLVQQCEQGEREGEHRTGRGRVGDPHVDGRASGALPQGPCACAGAPQQAP